jgi:hypothetical protein
MFSFLSFLQSPTCHYNCSFLLREAQP